MAKSNNESGAESRKETTGRGSPEAIEKRKVARQLNTLFSDKAKQPGKLDGRTAKRRLRLLKELKEGRKGEPLKAIDFLSHAHELVGMGESYQTLKKNGAKLPKGGFDGTEESRELIKRAQAAYGFEADAWKLLGVDLNAVLKGSVKSATKN